MLSDSISWFDVSSGLLGGVALSSFALKLMSGGLKQALGSQLKELIAASTSNVVLAFLTGTVATAVMSSSTATSRLVVELVSVGAMTFEQSLGVSLGINVGSTVATQLVALKLTDWALFIVALGYLVQAFAGKRSASGEGVGRSVLGLGLLFLGIDLMSKSMSPLKEYPPFLSALAALSQPALGVLAAALLTALVQSSAVVIAIVMTLAGKGLIPLPMAVSLVVGANVGTCSSALLSAIGGRRETMRVAVTYLLYKAAGAILCLLALGPLAAAVARLSAPGGAGQALVEAEAVAAVADREGESGVTSEIGELRRAVVPQVVANVHVVFNLGVGLAFLPLTSQVSRLMTVLVPPEHGSASAKGHNHRAIGRDGSSESEGQDGELVQSGKLSPAPVSTAGVAEGGQKAKGRRRTLTGTAAGRRGSSRGRAGARDSRVA